MVRYGRTVEPGYLPVFSVDTEEDARQLLIAACPTNQKGEFVAPELAHDQNLDNLYAFGHRLEKVWDRIVENRRGERMKRVLAVSIGNRIRRARERLDLSQKELSELSGVTRPAISRFEQGHLVPSVENLRKLVIGLSVNANDLLGLSEKPVVLNEDLNSLVERLDKASSATIWKVCIVADALLKEEGL